jgi:hypothetical protein
LKEENKYDLIKLIINDIDLMRLRLPAANIFKVKITTLMKMVKDLIGKDLSKFSMPVWINEPVSILQKPAEFMLYFADAFN